MTARSRPPRPTARACRHRLCAPTSSDPLHQVTAEMWPGMLIIPSMSIGASDSIYTIMAGLPSYGIGGAAIE